MSERDPVKGASRTLDLLEVFTEAQAPMSLTELAQRTGIPLSSCHALVRTLQTRGYLYVAGHSSSIRQGGLPGWQRPSWRAIQFCIASAAARATKPDSEKRPFSARCTANGSFTSISSNRGGRFAIRPQRAKPAPRIRAQSARLRCRFLKTASLGRHRGAAARPSHREYDRQRPSPGGRHPTQSCGRLFRLAGRDGERCDGDSDRQEDWR